MHPRHRYAIAVAALTLIVLALRLLISYQVAQPGYEGYFTLIQGESILENGLPRHEDPYSFLGRTYAFNPAFYYVMAFFLLLLPDFLALKLMPNLFMVSLVPLFYLLGHSLTKNRGVSLITALLGGFAPLLFTSHLNRAVPSSLALPLAAALLLALLDLERRPLPALILTAALTLVSPIVWLFLPTYMLYLLILAAERLKIEAAYLEAGLFTFLLAAWHTLITYKDALFLYGIGAITESLPTSVREAAFADFTFLAMIYAIGVVPLALGSLAIYQNTFEVRIRRLFLVAAFAIASLLAAVLSILPLMDALLLLSLAFIIMAAPGLQFILSYLRKTRLPGLAPWTVAALLLLFALSSVLPAFISTYPQSSPTPEEIEAMQWLADTPDESVILARPVMGYLINYESRRRYVADRSFLLIPDASSVLDEIDVFYTTPSTVHAVEIAQRHGVTHIFLGPQEHQQYPRLGALNADRHCFPVVFENTRVRIHSVRCRLA